MEPRLGYALGLLCVENVTNFTLGEIELTNTFIVVSLAEGTIRTFEDASLHTIV